jgi:tyrosyl-tRNA synthetase
MKLSEELVARGFIGQFSADSLGVILDEEKRVVYHGIDPSADSAHVGNFVLWMLLRHLIAHGHTVIFLVGGGTGMIGDPKPDAERQLSAVAEVQERVARIKAQAENILGGQPVEFVNNYDWLAEVGLLTFLRDIGKNFTVGELIKKDAIARRLAGESGLSYTEFAYPLLQAFDYLTLYRTKNCTLQIGGSDQWGNIIAGVDLIRRMEQVTVHALTVPLVIDKVTGKKFGKSEGNAVWLAAEKTSPYAFYQFWLNVADENVIDYLKLFTLLPLLEIAQIAAELAANPSSRQAQKTLAAAVTTLVHGVEACHQVEQVTAGLFGTMALTELSPAAVEILCANAPLVKITKETTLVDALVESTLATSKREARTFIEEGAVALDGEKVTDLLYSFTAANSGDLLHLKRGRKQVSLLEII